MLSSYPYNLATVQQNAFKQQAIRQQQSLTGLGMLASTVTYSPLAMSIYDQMRYDINKWLEDWDK